MSSRDLVTIPFVEVRERWYVPLDVGLERGEFLVDSEATTSLVTKRFYDFLSSKPELLTSEIEVRTANGTPVKTLGFATFPLGIAKRVYMITCNVSCMRQGAVSTARLTADLTMDPYRVRFAEVDVQPSSQISHLPV